MRQIWMRLPALLALLSPLVRAQEALGEAAAAEANEVGAITLGQILQMGGPIMNVLVVLSFVSVGLIIFYLLTMRAALVCPPAFVQEAEDAAESGDIETLRQLCQDNGSAIAKVIRSAIEHSSDNLPANYEAVRDAMEEEGARQAGLLWQRLQYLMDVAIISPMVGLLGTVWGMMISFAGLESGMNIINKADALASGVAQAMYTTFGGLIVGIFSMAAYALLRGRVSNLISTLERSCGTILRRLAANHKERGPYAR